MADPQHQPTQTPAHQPLQAQTAENQETEGHSMMPPAFSLEAETGGTPLGSGAPIQRDANDEITAPFIPRSTAFEIWTYAELTAYYRYTLGELQACKRRVEAENLGVPESLENAIMEAEGQIELNGGGGATRISEGIKTDSVAWVETFSSAMSDGEMAIAWAASRELSAARARYRAMKREINERVLPTIRENQRSAFRSDDSSALSQIADTLATALDCSLTLDSVIRAIGTERAVLENMRNAANGMGHLYPNANSRLPAVMTILDRINRGYAAFTLLRTGINLMNGNTTEMGEALDGVSAMATVYASVGTLMGASAGVTLYANLYLAPMVSACVTMLGRIADIRSRTHNRGMIALGHYNTVNWTLEPGGRPMFDYMLTVMRASRSSNVSSPSGDARDYFLSQQSNFNAGVGRGGEMPTTGALFWEDINSSEFRTWVFSNRQDVWAMLYGGMPVPRH